MCGASKKADTVEHKLLIKEKNITAGFCCRCKDQSWWSTWPESGWKVMIINTENVLGAYYTINFISSCTMKHFRRRKILTLHLSQSTRMLNFIKQSNHSIKHISRTHTHTRTHARTHARQNNNNNNNTIKSYIFNAHNNICSHHRTHVTHAHIVMRIVWKM